MPLPITSATAAVLIVLLVLLGAWVALGRMGKKVRYETGGDPDMVLRIRAHANLAENAAIGLLAMALIELQAGDSQYLWGLAAALVGGRVLHALGVLAKIHLFRVIGISLTWAMLLAAAVCLACSSGYMPRLG